MAERGHQLDLGLDVLRYTPPPNLKVSTPAHTKHPGWYVEFESRGSAPHPGCCAASGPAHHVGPGGWLSRSELLRSSGAAPPGVASVKLWGRECGEKQFGGKAEVRQPREKEKGAYHCGAREGERACGGERSTRILAATRVCVPAWMPCLTDANPPSPMSLVPAQNCEG